MAQAGSSLFTYVHYVFYLLVIYLFLLGKSRNCVLFLAIILRSRTMSDRVGDILHSVISNEFINERGKKQLKTLY